MSQILPYLIYFEKVTQPNTGSNTIVLKHTHDAPLAEKYLNVFASQSVYFAFAVTQITINAFDTRRFFLQVSKECIVNVKGLLVSLTLASLASVSVTVQSHSSLYRLYLSVFLN